MLHFPSSLSSSSSPSPHPTSSLPRRSDSLTQLNATQQKASSNPLLLKIEEELHDARRVHSHGQEEDLRLALDMVIKRVMELTSLLDVSLKTQADLEVELNVTKSNLKLVISNNEMLEDALRRDTSGQSMKDVGWKRRTGNGSLERGQSVDNMLVNGGGGGGIITPTTPNSAFATPTVATSTPPAPAPPQETTRFFRFRFSGSTTTPSSATSSRPSTPSTPATVPPNHHPSTHLTSPSMPILPSSTETGGSSSKVSEAMEELEKELEKERNERIKVSKEKAALEEELENLSQALFEEANKMVATERMKRAETEEELKELQMEKVALQSALRVVSAQESGGKGFVANEGEGDARSRTSSTIALKSRPTSLDLSSSPSPSSAFGSDFVASSLPPLPPSPSSSIKSSPEPKSPVEEEAEPTPTPRFSSSSSSSLHNHFRSHSSEDLEPMTDPWADAPSTPKPWSP